MYRDVMTTSPTITVTAINRNAAAAIAGLKTYLLPRYPDRDRVWLTVNLANPAAIAVYRKAGFTDIGEIWLQGRAGPQMIMFMSLK